VLRERERAKPRVFTEHEPEAIWKGRMPQVLLVWRTRQV
jgi:hypothetical protein